MIMKKLHTIGNSRGIIVPKIFLSLIEADKNTQFKMKLEGNKLIIEKHEEPEKKEKGA